MISKSQKSLAKVARSFGMIIGLAMLTAGLIGIGVQIRSQYLVGAELIESHYLVDGRSTYQIGLGQGSPNGSGATVSWKLAIDYEDSVFVGDNAIISVSIADISVVLPELVLDDLARSQKERSQLLNTLTDKTRSEFLSQLEMGRAISAELIFPGGTFAPSEISNFRPGQNEHWSIGLPSAGTKRGFIKIKKLEPHSSVIYVSHDDVPVTIVVKERIFSFRSILAVLGILFGSFLTLPSILAVLDRRGLSKGGNPSNRPGK